MLQEHPEWARSAVWAAMAGPGLIAAPGGVFTGAKWLYRDYRMQPRGSFLSRARAMFGPGPRPPAPTWANSSLTRDPLQLLLRGKSDAVFRVLDHRVVAGTTPDQSLLKGGLKTLPQRAGLVRGLGVVGGVTATGASLANVAAQGNPVEAWQRNGVEYAADVSELAFNASLTALMVAPNPVTAGATVVTGVAYATTEVIAHWDDITTLWNDTTQVAGELVGEAGQAIGDAASDAAGAIGDVAQKLNPFR